jgi:hypothetical protein
MDQAFSLRTLCVGLAVMVVVQLFLIWADISLIARDTAPPLPSPTPVVGAQAEENPATVGSLLLTIPHRPTCTIRMLIGTVPYELAFDFAPGTGILTTLPEWRPGATFMVQVVCGS